MRPVSLPATADHKTTLTTTGPKKWGQPRGRTLFPAKPASALAERNDTEASLEKHKAALREDILRLRQQHNDSRNALNVVLRQQRQAEIALDDAKLNTRRAFARDKKAQQVIDLAARLQQREALKRGLRPSPWEDTPVMEDNGPELG